MPHVVVVEAVQEDGDLHVRRDLHGLLCSAWAQAGHLDGPCLRPGEAPHERLVLHEAPEHRLGPPRVVVHLRLALLERLRRAVQRILVVVARHAVQEPHRRKALRDDKVAPGLLHADRPHAPGAFNVGNRLRRLHGHVPLVLGIDELPARAHLVFEVLHGVEQRPHVPDVHVRDLHLVKPPDLLHGPPVRHEVWVLRLHLPDPVAERLNVHILSSEVVLAHGLDAIGGQVSDPVSDDRPARHALGDGVEIPYQLRRLGLPLGADLDPVEPLGQVQQCVTVLLLPPGRSLSLPLLVEAPAQVLHLGLHPLPRLGNALLVVRLEHLLPLGRVGLGAGRLDVGVVEPLEDFLAQKLRVLRRVPCPGAFEDLPELVQYVHDADELVRRVLDGVRERRGEPRRQLLLVEDVHGRSARREEGVAHEPLAQVLVAALPLEVRPALPGDGQLDGLPAGAQGLPDAVPHVLGLVGLSGGVAHHVGGEVVRLLLGDLVGLHGVLAPGRLHGDVREPLLQLAPAHGLPPREAQQVGCHVRNVRGAEVSLRPLGELPPQLKGPLRHVAEKRHLPLPLLRRLPLRGPRRRTPPLHLRILRARCRLRLLGDGIPDVRIFGWGNVVHVLDLLRRKCDIYRIRIAAFVQELLINRPYNDPIMSAILCPAQQIAVSDIGLIGSTTPSFILYD